MFEIGKKYIFRCDRSGVFFGEFAGIDGKLLKIKNSRKIWSWNGAFCCEQLSIEGTKSPDKCKFTMTVSEIIVSDFIQVLPCTEEAINSIESVTEWRIK